MLAKNKYSIDLLPSTISLQLVESLKILRKQFKYSQKELALRSGVSLGSIKRFESTGKISLESLLKMAQVLGRLDDFKSIFYLDVDLENVKSKFDE